MARRKIYRCECANNRCTIRTYKEDPPHCAYWNDYSCWIRVDKHKPELEDWNNE